MNKTELIDQIAAGAGLTKVSQLLRSPLVRVSTPLPSRRLRSLPRRLLSSRLVLSSLRLSTNNSCKEKFKRASPLGEVLFSF